MFANDRPRARRFALRRPPNRRRRSPPGQRTPRHRLRPAASVRATSAAIASHFERAAAAISFQVQRRPPRTCTRGSGRDSRSARGGMHARPASRMSCKPSLATIACEQREDGVASFAAGEVLAPVALLGNRDPPLRPRPDLRSRACIPRPQGRASSRSMSAESVEDVEPLADRARSVPGRRSSGAPSRSDRERATLSPPAKACRMAASRSPSSSHQTLARRCRAAWSSGSRLREIVDEQVAQQVVVAVPLVVSRRVGRP